ncbi:MAG: endopeptidase La [Fimbriimonas sp.]
MPTKRAKSPSEPILRVPVLAVRDVVHFPGLVNALHVVRDASLRAVRRSMTEDHIVLVLSQRDMAIDEPGAADLYDVGTLSEALQTIPLPDSSVRVALRALRRVRARSIVSEGGLFWAEIEPMEETTASGPEAEAASRAALQAFTSVVERNPEIPPEALQGLAQIDEPGPLADSIAHHLPLRTPEKQALLEEPDHARRLNEILRILQREVEILDLKQRIHARVETEIGQSHRDFYLREQLRIIQEELREREDRVGEVEEYRERIAASGMPVEAQERAEAEIRRLDRTPAASPEGMVLRNYLDTLVALPWNRLTDDRLDVTAAAQLLDERHHGLHRVKDRILDHLAVRQLRGSLRGPILCFQGPPGVGKTSIGRSIAEAMGRRFVRIALGGVRDEAEIRGHRRTYVGSLPGRIMQGLKDCGSRNPVILLDEIDKLASGSQGDPTSALLEALDPEQNERFSDHYVETPFDLSAVMFIATANLLENVPAPLRDRMETISFPSYTEAERTEIARRFLFPRALTEHGLAPAQAELPDPSLTVLVQDYTREAGVRDLGRQINALCRKSARRIAERSTDRVVLDEGRLQEFLGHPRYRRLRASLQDGVGSAWAMVVSESGGDLMTIEVALSPACGDRPALRLTGNLGNVMQESAHAALTAVRPHLEGVDFRQDLHVHVPEAAVPKDGPSAGLTIAVCLASAFLDRPIRGDVAMTGEITLRGRVLPIGGVPEKVLAAARAGMAEVILPEENAADLSEVAPETLAKVKIHLVSDLKAALAIALREA